MTVVESKTALSHFITSSLNDCGAVGRDAVAALLSGLIAALGGDSFACFFLLVLPEAVDAVQAELPVWEAQVADAGLGASAAGARVDDGVADAGVLQPAGLAAVQQLELPGGVQLTHFGHHGAVSDARLHGLGVVHLLEAFEEIHFA